METAKCKTPIRVCGSTESLIYQIFCKAPKFYNYAISNVSECETPLEAHFFVCMIAEKDCIDAVKHLDINNNTVPSSIPDWALKDGISIRSLSALTFNINAFIRANKFPFNLKTAEVIPVYKKMDKLEPTNYRPIYIIPVLSNVF